MRERTQQKKRCEIEEEKQDAAAAGSSLAFKRTQSRLVSDFGTTAQLRHSKLSTSRACRRKRRRTATRVLHLLEHRRNSDNRRGTRTQSCRRVPSAGYVSRVAAVALERALDTPGALSPGEVCGEEQEERVR